MISVKVDASGIKRAAQLPKRVNAAETILAVQIMKDTRPFVPALTGSQVQRTHIDGGNTIVYEGPYARYLYYGVKMVDSITGRGPFYIEDVGFRYRRGATLIPTSIPLNYTKTMHPLAGPKWFERSKAANLEKWVRVARKAIEQYG